MRGVFWIIEGELRAFPFEEGEVHEYGVAKSGNNFNHKLLWPHAFPHIHNLPFDYYPRGRVEYKSDGTPIIYMNPGIGDEHIGQIVEAFGLSEEPAPVRRDDYSDHYMCEEDRLAQGRQDYGGRDNGRHGRRGRR